MALNVSPILNRELGLSARNKLNELITYVNNIESLLPEGPQGPQGIQGPPGPDVRVNLNVIGFSDDIADLPESANAGEAFLITSVTTAGDNQVEVYLYIDDEWKLAFGVFLDSTAVYENIIYVSSTIGDNANNDGYTMQSPVATIAKALEIGVAETGTFLVSVLPGTYTEDGNLEIPANCGVVSIGGQYVTDIVASTTCRDNFRNMFLLNSGSYIQGFTFRNQKIDNFNNPTGGFAVAFAPNALIVRSPYVRDIGQVSNYDALTTAQPLDPTPDGFSFTTESYTVEPNPLVGAGGGVILADRAVIDQNSSFPYILAFAATPRSPNGIGYVAKNGAGINGISSISVFQQCSFFALNGGQITLNNSGTQFGDISMRATGSTTVVRPNDYTRDTNGEIYSSTTDAATVNSNAETIVSDLMSQTFVLTQTVDDRAIIEDKAEKLLEAIELDMKAGTDQVTKSFLLAFFDYKADYIFGDSIVPTLIQAFEYVRDELNTVFSGNTDAIAMVTELVDNVVVGTMEGIDETNSGNTFEFGSLIESLGHQFNNAGSGVNRNALPLNFRRPGRNQTVPFTILQESGGRVRWSGADELNNQYFAGGTVISGITGKIEGRPFNTAVRQIARRLMNSRGQI